MKRFFFLLILAVALAGIVLAMDEAANPLEGIATLEMVTSGSGAAEGCVVYLDTVTARQVVLFALPVVLSALSNDCDSHSYDAVMTTYKSQVKPLDTGQEIAFQYRL